MDKHDYILLERLVAQYGEKEVLNELNIPRGLIKKVAKGAIAAGLAFGGASQLGDNIENNQIEIQKPSNPFGFSDSEYELYLDRVEAVKQEIDRVFKKRGIVIENLHFSPEHLVYLCHKYDFDIPLLLAQARAESCFGTTKRAKKCNTMFSLGQYDDGRNLCKFETFDDGIEAYIKTIKKHYLLDGQKSVNDLLKDKCYVDYKGDRYASNKRYEKDLRIIRNDIISMYPVLSNNINPEKYSRDTYNL